MRMGLREANQNFSKAIKAIKAGKAIVLTERGKPIATITPIVDETNGDDELQPLRDEGFLIGRRKSGLLGAQAMRQAIGRVSAADTLRKERDED
jgi:antitoxin (DNA-binding transcriptional repressor) of toxin-antitoxin stability system